MYRYTDQSTPLECIKAFTDLDRSSRNIPSSSRPTTCREMMHTTRNTTILKIVDSSIVIIKTQHK